MRGWVTGAERGSLQLVELPTPSPGRGELLLRVEACGVCRTDLHIIDRELPPHRRRVVPGHQIVGIVVGLGADAGRFALGDRVGVAWLRRTCGICRWCLDGRENLCPDSQYTGWDADGGFAELATVPEAFAYPLSPGADPVVTAPLLCAGIIGFRALMRANLPPGGSLGIYGFGSSAHVTVQLARAAGARIHVLTRGESSRALATALGAEFVGDERSAPPAPLDAAIVFAPAGDLVPLALQAIRHGGTVVLAGIHMSTIPALDYDRELFGERDLRSVASNTRADGAAFLGLAQQLRVTPQTHAYAFDALGEAVDALRAGGTAGSLVVTY